jgi:hypothetical protein
MLPDHFLVVIGWTSRGSLAESPTLAKRGWGTRKFNGKSRTKFKGKTCRAKDPGATFKSKPGFVLRLSSEIAGFFL